MIQVRLIIAVVLFSLGGLLVWWVPNHYREQGRQEVIREYEEVARVALQERKAAIERVRKDNENTNKLIIAEYESRLKILNERYIAARNTGLRVPKSTCQGLTTAPETPSPSRSNEDESIRLPSTIENGLFDLAKRADEVNVQLLACQTWIKQNGFYEHKP